MRIERVLALPGSVTASTMYVVQGVAADRAELYFTSADGLTTRHIIDESEITAIVTAAVASYSATEVVADIAARDALVLTANAVVLVIDATADATVATGAATYVWDNSGSSWTKVSEFESMDVVLDWANIANKPTATVGSIDDAVAKRHVHSNSTELDKIGEDGNGDLTYNGANPLAAIAVSDW